MKKPKRAFSFYMLYEELKMQGKLMDLQKKIGYQFHNQELLQSALMHSSYTNEKRLQKFKCNERCARTD